jgi:glycosyltransferase involved in cell wall biosynthesis
MRVGINATSLNDRPSGAKQRFVGIYGELFRQLPDSEFVIFGPSDCSLEKWFTNQLNVRVQTTKIPSIGRIGKFVAGIGYWKKVLPKENFGIFESLNLPLTKSPCGANLLTVHDIRGIQKGNSFLDKTIFSAVLRQALIKADHVITVSQAMRSEILDFCPQTPVSVVYNGLDTSEFKSVSQKDCEAFVLKHNLPRQFILAVGHLEYRKNYHRLIDAVAHLSKKSIDCLLVIIGNDSGEQRRLLERIQILGLNNKVRLISGLSDQEVRCAYAVSNLVVFSSVYEGFGIPILEAMAAKRPMVLSDIPVFKEITQGRYIYFQPNDFNSMADAIEKGLTDSEENIQMVIYGANRIKDFSFKNVAKNLADIYKSIDT